MGCFGSNKNNKVAPAGKDSRESRTTPSGSLQADTSSWSNTAKSLSSEDLGSQVVSLCASLRI
jgi:hypothetical protein